MRKFLSLVIAVIMVLGVVPFSALTVLAQDNDTSEQTSEAVTITNGDYSLTVNKTQFEVGEEIIISATANSSNDWVGIYETNQTATFLWDYVSTYGNEVSFDAREMTQQGGGYTEELGALPEGRYVIRLVPQDKSGISESVCHVVITVGNPGMVEGDSTLMHIEKNTFAPGESVMVSGKGSGKDWIGIYKLNVHNVTYNNLWKYIANVGQDVEFDVSAGGNLPEGDYLLCLIKNDASKPTNASAWALISVVEESDITDPDNPGGGETPDPDNPGSGETTDPEDPEQGETTDPTVPEGMELLKYEGGQYLIFKTEYDVNEAVYVYAKGVNTKDWVGITERGNTDAAIRWQYIDSSQGGAGQGQGFDLRLASNVGGAYNGKELANLPAGEYTIHLVQNDGYIKNGASVIVVDITIVDNTTGGGGDNTGGEGDDDTGDITETELLKLDKTIFKLGEPIMVTAISSDDTDWVGIFNTSGSYLKWHYVTSTLSGVPYDVTQGTTIPEGTYTIRLIAKDGAKDTPPLASIEITIVDDDIDAPTSATYNVNNEGSGYANGTVSVTMPQGQTDNRSIVMYWANENGKLEGYTSLARFKVTGETTSFTFTNSLVIPTGATQLHVYAQSTSTGLLSENYISIDLPTGSDMSEQNKPNNTIWIISDIHIGKGNGVVSATNFKKMLSQAISLNPDGIPIFIVGDMADNGTEAQFAEMMSLHAEVMAENGKDATKFPLFLTLGNHDYPSMFGTFLKYATLPDGTHPEKTSYDFWLDGYHYIFLGSDTNSGLYATLGEETLAWLDEKLSECRSTSRPTFVFLHQPMYNTVSGSLPGENWNGVNNEEALRAVLKKYPEVMLFNGHTHWEMNSVGNIFEGTEELPIHIFNCASVSYLWSGYNTITGENLDGSQGYYVEMYDGKIFVRGRDFIKSEWISSAQYSIELEKSEGDGHTYNEQSLTYENGYLNNGKLVYKCSECGMEKATNVAPIIVNSGYSISTFNTSSICVGYEIDFELLEKYEELNQTTIRLGIAAAPYDALVNAGKLINPDGTTKDVTSGAVINYELSRDYKNVNLILKSSDWTKYMYNKVVLCAYIIENDTVGYICEKTEITDAATYITYAGLTAVE